MYEYAIVLCSCFRIGYRRWKWAAKACFCIRNSRPKGIRWSYITTCPWRRSIEKTTTIHRPQEEKYSNTLAYSYKQDTLSTTLYIGTLFLMLGSLVRFLPLGLSENLKGFRAFSRKCRQQAKGANFTQISRNDRRRHSIHFFGLHCVLNVKELKSTVICWVISSRTKKGAQVKEAHSWQWPMFPYCTRERKINAFRVIYLKYCCCSLLTFLQRKCYDRISSLNLSHFFFLQTMSPWKWIFPKPSIA